MLTLYLSCLLYIGEQSYYSKYRAKAKGEQAPHFELSYFIYDIGCTPSDLFLLTRCGCVLTGFMYCVPYIVRY